MGEEGREREREREREGGVGWGGGEVEENRVWRIGDTPPSPAPPNTHVHTHTNIRAALEFISTKGKEIHIQKQQRSLIYSLRSLSLFLSLLLSTIHHFHTPTPVYICLLVTWCMYQLSELVKPRIHSPMLHWLL